AADRRSLRSTEGAGPARRSSRPGPATTPPREAGPLRSTTGSRRARRWRPARRRRPGEHRRCAARV
ncbi:MAG: hypothetical protein AVDCRST_MAG20-304, partial [uncultured Acidimicrobiales bacterium]